MSVSGPRLRLFFALWPDAALRREISRATRAAVRASGGRPVPAENYHITLAFLGNVAESRLPELEKLAGTLRAEPFELTLGQLGFFAGPRALWLGLAEPCEALLTLQQGFVQMLGSAAWPVERRPFLPHMTLARKARDVGARQAVKPLRWRVEGFSLIRSITDPSGAIYQQLERWPLSAD
jgi:2'-5' RNA ligase